MKNRIYKYFFSEFIRYFAVVLFASVAIIWTIQAVNYLDLVTEDGHAFRIYLFYSLLTISKVLTKLIPFTFLIASIITILKLQRDNELIVLWTSGLNKIFIVNLIFRISILMLFVQLLMATAINPKTLNVSRILLKNSELQFVSSLLKVKQFNDTLKGLTIFVENKKVNGTYENIFIKDEGRVLTKVSGGSSTIFAKSGYMSADEKSLILYNGNIQKLNEDGDVNIVKFKKTTLNLAGISTKSISEPKMQETPTIQILLCLQNKNYSGMYNCGTSDRSRMDIKIEINKRFGMPVYIPLISLICCFLLGSRKDKKMFYLNKYIYFFIGFLILTLAEIIVRYSGISWNHTFIYYLIPLGMSPLLYFALIRTFKYENLS